MSDDKPETCGKPAAPLVPRWGWSFACVLAPGHDGECCPGGDCIAHGKYVGRPGETPQCPEWPRCIEDGMIKVKSLENRNEDRT